MVASRVLTVWWRGGDLSARLAELRSDPRVEVTELDGVAPDRRIRLDAPTAAVVDHAVAQVEAGLGDQLISRDGQALGEVVVDLAAVLGVQVAAAESLTSGLVASMLAEPPGGGEVFAGSVVAYSTEVKRQVLGVPGVPAVSVEAARAMAEGVRDLLGADLAVAATGVAGPDPQDGQPVGTIYVAVCGGGAARVVDASTSGARQEIRRAAASTALNELRLELLARSRG